MFLNAKMDDSNVVGVKDLEGISNDFGAYKTLNLNWKIDYINSWS